MKSNSSRPLFDPEAARRNANRVRNDWYFLTAAVTLSIGICGVIGVTVFMPVTNSKAFDYIILSIVLVTYVALLLLPLFFAKTTKGKWKGIAITLAAIVCCTLIYYVCSLILRFILDLFY